jgi:outer membrane protein
MLTAIVLSALVASATLAAQAGASRPQTPAAPPAQTPTVPRPAPPAATAPAPAPAPALPFPADAKIGFVDPQMILEQSVAGKAGIAQINKMVEPKQQEMAAKNKIAVALDQEIRSQQAVLSPAVLSAKQADLAKLQNELQFMQTQLQADADAMEKRMLQEFQDKVIPIIDKLREEKGLWAILTPGAQAAAVDPRLDLSAEVVKRLDAVK